MSVKNEIVSYLPNAKLVLPSLVIAHALIIMYYCDVAIFEVTLMDLVALSTEKGMQASRRKELEDCLMLYHTD